jgi:hypothetical protein
MRIVCIHAAHHKDLAGHFGSMGGPKVNRGRQWTDELNFGTTDNSLAKIPSTYFPADLQALRQVIDIDFRCGDTIRNCPFALDILIAQPCWIGIELRKTCLIK